MRPGASGAESAIRLNPVQELGLLVSSAALFFLAFPNPLITWGLGPLGFIALAPLFLLYNSASWLRLMAFGPLSGFIIYLLFNHWLGAYHPLAIFIVPLIMAGEFFVLALAFRLCRQMLPRMGWMLQLAVWVGFEYLHTLGFLGYPYGIIGYTQYLFLPLARLSALTGVWGVSALVVFPSIWLAWRVAELPSRDAAKVRGSGAAGGPWAFVGHLRGRPWPLMAWMVLLGSTLVWGGLQYRDYSSDPVKRMVLVQQNVDPWIGGNAAYTKSLDALIRQTTAGLAATPGVELVVWSETCFIPAIEWHEKYRDDPERYPLVKRLKDYLATMSAPVVLGNGEAEPWSDGSGRRLRRDYNAVLVYQGRTQTGSYRKMRLIPFTESFPYREQFPWMYQLLVDNDTSLWEAGTDFRILEAAGLRFGTPICFEDSFGSIGRDFFNGGADLLINLSNDSWSKSVAGAMQHLAMATFRAMENQRSVVRSTNGGMSALIDPNGWIVRMNEPFTESWMAIDVPIHDSAPTPYRQWGDWFGAAAALVAALGLSVAGIIRGVLLIRSRIRKTN